MISRWRHVFWYVDRLRIQHALDCVGVAHDGRRGLVELMRERTGKLANRGDAGEVMMDCVWRSISACIVQAM
jgi:hypothetical protein